MEGDEDQYGYLDRDGDGEAGTAERAMRLGITAAQRHQIDRLTVQLGIKTIAERNACVAREVGRPITHLVDLNSQEAQAVIEVLKVEVKARQNDSTGASHHV